MSMPFDSFGDGGGGTLRNIRLESLIDEPLINTYSDEDGSVVSQEHGGQTGLVIALGGETVNTITGEVVMLLYSLLKSGFQVGIGADGRLYFGRGRWVGDEEGLRGYNAQGVMQIQLSSEDGSIYAAGGAMRIDQDAVTLEGLLYALIHNAENGGTERTGRIGMVLPDGSTAPAWQFVFNSPAGTNLCTNGDFELGALTNWATTGSSNVTWSVITPRINGYTAVVTFDSTTATAQALTDRMAAVAGTYYELSFKQRFSVAFEEGSLPTFASALCEVKWYDHATAGSLIRTDTIPLSVIEGLVNKAQGFTAPTGALSAEVLITVTNPSSIADTPSLDLDDFTFGAVSVQRQIVFLPNMTIKGGPLQIEEQSEPTVDAGTGAVYFDTSGVPRAKNDAGDVMQLSEVYATTPPGYFVNAPAGGGNGTTTTVAVASNDQTRFQRVYVPYRMKLARVCLEITTAVAASVIGVGVYDLNGTRIDYGTVASTTTGEKTLTLASGAQYIGPGFYWIAWTCTHNTVQARLWNRSSGGTDPYNWGTQVYTGTAANNGASGVPPSSLGVLTESATIEALAIKIESL